MNTPLPASPGRITDFGKKIGGARKDLRGNFRLDDIATLTAVERDKLVRKDMVWPTPDYAALIASGYTREAAAMVKMMRDAFPSAPQVIATAAEEIRVSACELFVSAINTAKAICQQGKTPAELSQAYRNHEDAAVYLSHVEMNPERSVSWRSSAGSRLDEWRNGPMSFDWRTVYSMQETFSSFGIGQLDRTTRRLLLKNKEWPNGTSLAEAWLRKQSFSIVPLPDGGFGLGEYDSPAPSYRYDYLRRGPLAALVGVTFKDEQEAKAALRKAAEGRFTEKRAAAKAKRDATLARAKGAVVDDGYRRNGPDWRAGRVVVGNDYLHDFALRGGEFGLWVNQQERQEVLDRGYDAFRDLAEIYGWTPESLSLGGKLAIAFGARGRGGWAAAHYEPGREVINLTKPSGEGCLAHEWAHALDHYLGNRAHALGIVSKTTDLGVMLSNCELRRLVPLAQESDEVRYIREIRAAMETIWRVTYPYTRADLIRDAQKSHDEVLRNAVNQVALIYRTIPNLCIQNGRTPEEAQVIADELKPHLDKFVMPGARHDIFTVEETCALIRQRAGRKGNTAWIDNNLGYFSHHLRRTSDALTVALAKPEEWQGPPRTEETKYVAACRSLDGEKKRYYALPHEMFARAFEAVTYDALKSQDGRSSPFLVQGTFGEAYPQDVERSSLGQQLGTVLRKLQQHLPTVIREAAPAMPPLPTAAGNAATRTQRR
ncbi:LPD1 domain-containing protein [Oleiharenicola sp. Vm1]|uniref:LPD1 domain-containing protein n=1 Tax=Oleiharenicola sp. Vm1 TaxID=3398393 RepID=UPI0039F4E875